MRPEIELLLLCGRLDITAPKKARINTLLKSDLDWTFLIEASLQHQVTPLLYHVLNSAETTLIPSDIKKAFHIRNAVKDRNQSLCCAMFAIVDTFKKHSIDIMPFKGPILAFQAYGDCSLRIFGDLDFLIHKQNHTAAVELLQRLGYTRQAWNTSTTAMASWQYNGQDFLFHEEVNVTIEPHWLFAPRSFSVDFDYAGLWQRAHNICIDGHKIPALSPEDHLIIICVHGCKEHWIRIKQVCDVAAFMQNQPALDWQVIHHRAHEQGCLRMLLIGLHLAQILFKVKLPPIIEKELARDRMPVLLAKKARHWLLNEQRTLPNINKIHLFHYRLRDRWWDGIKYILRTWFMPSDKHFRMVTLPEKLFWLYYPIKFIHDHFLLPFWLLWKRVSCVT